MRNTQEQINYLTIEQSMDLVDRIAKRTELFNYTMSEEEKVAMSELLCGVGVKTSDLIDVSNLADNYAINAEIATPEEVNDYDQEALDDALFFWKEDGKIHYCLTW